MSALAVALVALGMLAAPANAATNSSAQPLGHKVTTGMTAHQVVSTTPNAAGGVLTLDNGQKLQLPAAQFHKWQAMPHPTPKAATAPNAAASVLPLGNSQKLQFTGALFQTSNPTYKTVLAAPFGVGGVSVGNCGSSWINYDAVGGRNARLVTGFDVVLPAISYGWSVGVFDNAGASQPSWGNDNYTGGTQWAGYDNLINMAYGYSWAQISGSSYALLSDGTICVSGSPSDDTNIY